MNLPLSIGDELLRSRILEADRETVTFEHELLKAVFPCGGVPEEGRSEANFKTLEKPKYIGLAEFVMPTLSDESLIRGVTLQSRHRLLNDAFRGKLGAAAERIVREECESLLKRSR